MQTKKYGLLGYPLSHSLSPQIHERLFSYSNINATYELISIPEDLFENSIEELFSYEGFNITIPYKLKIIPYLKNISPQAKLFNSVNTVSCIGFDKNTYTGYNTDVFGFLEGVTQMGVDFKNIKVLLLGSGGSANMISSLAAQNNCDLTIAVREPSLYKADALKSRLLQQFSSANISTVDMAKIDGEYDLLVNATPVGMFPNTGISPVSEAVVKNCSYVYDLIYNPTQTQLLQFAHNQNKTYSNGLSMLVWQAAFAHKFWYNAEFTPSQIEEIINQIKPLVK